jgi:6-phosphogluconate dehydrogenase
MVGGDPSVVGRLVPLLKSLAPAAGFPHVGPVGAGHYVKMVHDGLEYPMMQAYAEGFEPMAESPDPVFPRG